MGKQYSKPRGRRIPAVPGGLRTRDSRDLEDLARIPVPLTRTERAEAHAAPRLVSRHARNAADAAQLLDVLGLTEAVAGHG